MYFKPQISYHLHARQHVRRIQEIDHMTLTLVDEE